MNFRPGPSRSQRKPVPREDALNLDRLTQAIEEAGLHVTAKQLLHFIRHAIEEREYFKFEFTKSLSLILELLVRAGA